jgi:hypothetical protein
MSDSMTRSSTLSVVLLVSTIFMGSMLHAHAARPSVEQSAASASQGDSDDSAEQSSYWHIWAAATAQ